MHTEYIALKFLEKTPNVSFHLQLFPEAVDPRYGTFSYLYARSSLHFTIFNSPYFLTMFLQFKV
jgi:hypothetical protein